MKAIITDLDRTLLHTDKSVSEHTIAVLKKCRDHGILVMAASARPLRNILIYNDLIGFDAITATKWNGIRHMLAYFNISPGDAVYFGDDNDDIEPVKKCGLGVAVSNAIPSVLAVADRIIDSNDMDGVVRFIEENIF